MVKVLLFGHALRQSVEEPEVECEVQGPMTVKALLEANQEKLGAALSFANKGELLVAVNRRVGTLDSQVRNGDTVKLTHQPIETYEGARWHNP